MIAPQNVKIDKQLHVFFDEMISELVEKFGSEIVSVALFGSGATKEWVKDKSDIDFILIVKSKSMKKTIENYLNSLILRLDRKFELGLLRTCSPYKEESNPFLSLIHKVETALFFGSPFILISLDQIDFRKGTISDSRVRLVTTVFDSLSIFIIKTKQTGVILYGRNFIDEILFSPSKFDKIRTCLAPLWIIIMSFLSVPVDKMFSLDHSIKANIWACEDVLFAFNIPLSTAQNELETLEAFMIKHHKMDFSHAKKNLILKNSFLKRNEVSRGFVAKHLLKTTFFVIMLFFYSSLIARKM